jgi:hypothetical protein
VKSKLAGGSRRRSDLTVLVTQRFGARELSVALVLEDRIGEDDLGEWSMQYLVLLTLPHRYAAEQASNCSSATRCDPDKPFWLRKFKSQIKSQRCQDLHDIQPHQATKAAARDAVQRSQASFRYWPGFPDTEEVTGSIPLPPTRLPCSSAA